ncbi:MAG: diaminopimelate decarboxylase [Bacteroidetes bacterium]|nr:diaminopimelate decarboxylase [Bacteroidota bacterium]
MYLTKKQYERPVIQRVNVGLMNKYGTRTEYEPVTHIDGNAVADLITAYGSPVFVLSEKTIRATFRDANRAFKTRYPKVQFAWSYKTNYISAVCNVFHQEGSWAEVVSGFEYQKAINNGVPGANIIFNGPDKSEAELIFAINNGSLIHIDHLDELYLIKEIEPQLQKRARVAIRVNMDTGVYPAWDRFGFNYEGGQAQDAINKIMLNTNMDLVGLHCHIGTFMLTPSAYAVAATKMSELALNVKKKFKKTLEYIDMGGGFASRNTLKGSYIQGADAAPSFDQYAEAISTAILNAGFTEADLPLLILETGRALIDEAGFLLGSVISNKRLADGRRATIMNFGVNILFTSFWYDHKITPAQPFGQHNESTVLYGPLCMNIDVIRENISLPPLKKNDQVVVHTVGAYNMTQWMQFIALRPAVVLIDMNQKPHVIRNKETPASIQKEEEMPAYLKEFKI